MVKNNQKLRTIKIKRLTIMKAILDKIKDFTKKAFKNYFKAMELAYGPMQYKKFWLCTWANVRIKI